MEIEEEKKLAQLFDKRVSQEVDGEVIGPEFAGYVFRISGGNDKQGFPMKQGILSNRRVRLLLRAGVSCYRPRRVGERKRKSVRGCIVGPDLAVLNLVVLRAGENVVPGLNDEASQQPLRLGPKRANNIRSLFALSKADDPRDFVVGRKVERKNGKTYVKKPKVQRLVTAVRRQRKHKRTLAKKKHQALSKENRQQYAKQLAQKHKDDRQKASSLRKSRKLSN